MELLTTEPDVRIDRHPVRDTMAEDVRRGLGRVPRVLPPKYFYDARGSQLFDQITTLPEYYPTRCERAILNRHAPAIVDGCEELIELGSGTASKTRALLYAMAARGELRRYVPLDVDESVVRDSALELVELYPGLQVHGVVGDFGRDLDHIPSGRQRLFAFLGGTIGNLYPSERTAFLEGLCDVMETGDRLLLGTDLVKDPELIEAAYNDEHGVTEEFNRNVLRVLNDGLRADFEPEAFEHVAVFDPERSWVEMRLRADGSQRVSIPGAKLQLELRDGEEIRTEISTKFTPETVEQELTRVGLELDAFLTDEDGLFALSVSSPR